MMCPRVGSSEDTLGAEELVYRVDQLDNIVFVNEQWDRFAAANSGDRIASAKLISRSLWDFISDRTTRELYRRIMHRARVGNSVRFEFRCDSPEYRRLMEMDVAGGAAGEVCFRTIPITQEARRPQYLLNSSLIRSDELLLMCSWCNKLLDEENWLEVDEAVARKRLFDTSRLPKITHGICEHCHQKMLTTIALS